MNLKVTLLSTSLLYKFFKVFKALNQNYKFKYTRLPHTQGIFKLKKISGKLKEF